MKVTSEKLENNKAKLTIELPEIQFEKYMDQAFKKAAQKLNIPGFRKGKAPRHIVEKMYGRELFMEDAIKAAIPETFDQAVQQAGAEYECLVYPSYDVVSTEKGEGLTFTAEYDLKPEVKLGQYKGLELTQSSTEATEEDVQMQLDTMQKRFSQVETIEEAAVLGDVTVIDFLGKVDEVPFEGGAGENYSLTLGSNSFIPGFEDQLVGVKAGEKVDVKVTFPEDYRATELAGKDAIFEVTVKEVKRTKLSELDDEFAKDVSEFETLEALKNDIKEKLSEQAKERVKAEVENQAIDKTLENTEIVVPQSFLEVRMDQLIDNFSRQIAQQGIGFQQYLDITGMTAEAMREQFKERAEKEIKIELVLEAVAQAEGIEVTEEDLGQEYERLAQQIQQTADEIRETYGSNEAWVNSLKYSVKMNKAAKLLVSEATIVA